jgi:AmmeMemoRadiSam system protein A
VSGPVRPEGGCTAAERALVLSVARAAVRAAARHEPPPALPVDLPARLCEPAGAFVGLHDATGLRGCVGSVRPEGPLAALVARMAAAAAMRDPRFAPLGPEELAGLRVEVSILSVARPIAPEAIDPAVHGLCLRHGARRAVLLPQVAVHHAWDRATLLAQLCEKAELPRDAWQDHAAELLAFTVEVVEGEV